MASGVLSFAQYLGGADNIQIEQIFPSTQRTLVYNYSTNINGWSFHLDHQTIVVDTVTFDRNTGQPNFSNSSVIGYFPSAVISTSSNVTVTSAATGLVNITIPQNLYLGPILPDARANVPITIVGVTWRDNSSPQQINTHRWAFIQCWEPGVTPGDPTASTSPLFTPIVVESNEL
jgi:hypothetical protein